MPEDIFIPPDVEVQQPTLGVINFPTANIAGENDDTVEKFQAAAATRFERYAAGRKQWEDVWRVMSYMYACAQNRTIAAQENVKGANLDTTDDARANTGSTLFFRTVRQNAAQYYSIHKSKDMPFEYEPFVNRHVFASLTEGLQEAEAHNVQARWVMKQDDYERKTQDFAEMVFKYGCAVEVIYMKRVIGSVKRTEPTYTYSIGPEGDLIIEMSGVTEVEDEFILKNYPSCYTVPIQNVYGDVNIAWENQDAVIFLDTPSYSDLYNEAANGNYNPELLLELTEDHLWDGVLGGTHLTERQEDQGITSPVAPVETGKFLRYNIFMKVPIADTDWDKDKNVPVSYWGTVIGNSIKEGLCLRLEPNPDPDGEIPGNLVNVFPGEPDQLYHIAPGQVIRSNYSVECTLKNQAIDNMTLRGLPIILERRGHHGVKDFTIKKNAVWAVDAADAITAFVIPDTTTQTVNLLEYIREDSRVALSMDKNTAGESFGARTSSLEANNINLASQQAPISTIRYIMAQRSPWYAKKIKSYMKRWAEPDQVAAITDTNGNMQTIIPSALYGEFDIKVSLVDEFESSLLRQQSINEVLAIVAQSDALQQRIDIGQLAQMILEEKKLPVGRLLLPVQDADARNTAQQENQAMLAGTTVPVAPGQNNGLHLAEHRAYRLRYNGIEDSYPTVQLLDQHIAETEAAIAGQGGSVTAPLPQGQQNQTEGEAAGNQIASALGG